MSKQFLFWTSVFGVIAGQLVFPDISNLKLSGGGKKATKEWKFEVSELERPRGRLEMSGEPGDLCDPSVKQFSGYFDAGEGGKKYFFWFFEAREKREDVATVMWLTGGPGCSSQLALFVENGPCEVNEAGDGTRVREHSWNKNANIFFVDQPPGTGFSEGEYDHDEVGVAEDMYHFLQALFAKFPEYNKRFSVFGESYAGHYVPAIARFIFEKNKMLAAAVAGTRGNVHVDMVAMGIGNGLTNAEEQYKWYPEMAYNPGSTKPVVDRATYERMKQAVGPCVEAIKACNDEGSYTCNLAMYVCQVGVFMPYQQTGLNPYDMRQKCEHPPLCYDFSNVGKFLNKPEVQKKLGVSKSWEECNMQVNSFFQQDFLRNFHQLLPDMLEANIKVLIYAGNVDFICNYLGNLHWTLELDWSGKKAFNAAVDAPYNTPDGLPIGKFRSHGPFTFLEVFQAGHMVPMDKPKESLVMFNQFLYDQFPPPAAVTTADDAADVQVELVEA